MLFRKKEANARPHKSRVVAWEEREIKKTRGGRGWVGEGVDSERAKWWFSNKAFNTFLNLCVLCLYNFVEHKNQINKDFLIRNNFKQCYFRLLLVNEKVNSEKT